MALPLWITSGSLNRQSGITSRDSLAIVSEVGNGGFLAVGRSTNSDLRGAIPFSPSVVRMLAIGDSRSLSRRANLVDCLLV